MLIFKLKTFTIDVIVVIIELGEIMRYYFNIHLKCFKNRDHTFFLLLVILSFILYAKAMSYDFFIFDDAFHLSEKFELNPFNFNQFIWFWSKSLIPMTYTVWGVITLIFGTENPLYFHLVNINIYAINVFLVYLVLRQFFKLYFKNVHPKKIDILSFMGTLFFLFHPTHVEATVWISELKGQLGLLFTLLSLNMFLKIKTDNSKLFLIRCIICWVFYILSVLSKPNFIITPFLLIFIDLFIFKNSIKKILMWAAILIIPSLFFGYLQVTRHSLLTSTNSLIDTLIISSNIIWFYLSKSFFPFNLSFAYQQSPFTTINSAYYLYAIILISTYLIMNSLNSRLFPLKKFTFSLLSFLMFVILLIPHLGIIPYPFQQNISTVSDRYLLFPTLVFSMFITYLLIVTSSLKKKYLKNIIFLGFGILIVSFSVQSIVQIKNWRSSETILKSSLKNNPLSYPLNFALAGHLWHHSKKEESLRYYLKSFELLPTQDNLMVIIDKTAMLKKENILINFLKKEFKKNPQLKKSILPTLRILKSKKHMRSKRSLIIVNHLIDII